MPVVQSQLPQGGAVHPTSPFPVTVGTAAVVAPGSAPSQAVLLPSAPTRYEMTNRCTPLMSPHKLRRTP